MRIDDQIQVFLWRTLKENDLITGERLRQRLSSLYQLFSGFELHEINGYTRSHQDSSSLDLNSSREVSAEYTDNDFFTETLRKVNPEKHLIIIKDTSITHITRSSLRRILRQAIETSYHLFYLCRWMDRCDLYDSSKNITYTSAYITRTYSPKGIQALMVSPAGIAIFKGTKTLNDGTIFLSGRRIIVDKIHDYILNGSISAYCLVPNIFSFDVSWARNDADFIRTTECMIPPVKSSRLNFLKRQGNGILAFFILLVFIVIIILGVLTFVY